MTYPAYSQMRDDIISVWAYPLSPYSGSNYDDVWAGVDIMCDLFHTLATAVAAHFDFTYRQEEEDGMREY